MEATTDVTTETTGQQQNETYKEKGKKNQEENKEMSWPSLVKSTDGTKATRQVLRRKKEAPYLLECPPRLVADPINF